MSEVSSAYRDLRVGGLASGLDTDSIVENLMKIEKAKVFSIEQQKTLAEWEQQAYRNVIDMVQDFMDSNFNLIDSDKSILSTTSYKSATLDSVTGAVSLMANGDAVNGTYVINAIDQIATASTVQSSGRCVEFITGAADLSAGPIAVAGSVFELRLDGVQKQIAFDSDYADVDSLAAAIQQKADEAFGAGRVTATVTDGKYLTLSAANSTLQVLGNVEGTDALPTLGISAGAQNIVNVNASAAEVFGETEYISFSINGVDFSFSKNDSIAAIMYAVNRSDAGVTMTYSTLSDRFTLKSDKLGASSQIVIENTGGSLFGADGDFKIDTGTTRNGQDAIFYLNDAGMTNPIVRSDNVFTIDGVTYSLKAETDEAVTYTVADDVDKAKEKIQSFVSDYNTLLEKIAALVAEQKDSDYAPLSDEQKEEMSEDEIKKWEETAKKGILESDTLLGGMYRRMRSAFSAVIEGMSVSFADAGITTSTYTEKGKLLVNEDKLTEALQKDLSGVMALFTATSDVAYSRDMKSSEAAERYNESGFAQRINDIFKDYVTTKRNEAGLKGLLIEKAGIVGDSTEFSNTISERIEDLEEKIDAANERMYNQEDKYWDAFTALEQAVNTMNSQSSFMNSMLGQQ